MATVQRNGWKLADVFDGAVPGQAVVHVGHNAQIYAMDARLLQHRLNDAAISWGGEEYLVDKLLARILEEGIERSDNICRGGPEAGTGVGQIDEALEGVAQVTDALNMVTERVRLRPCADNEHVARANTAVKAAINKQAVDKPAQTERNGDQRDGDQHDATRNVVGVNQVEGACEQKSGGEAGLQVEPLLVENARHAQRRVKLQPLAAHDDGDGKAAQKGQQDPHRAVMDKRAVPEASGAGDRPGVLLAERGENGGAQDGDRVQYHPELDRSARAARCIQRQSWLPIGGDGDRSRKPLPEVRTRHGFPWTSKKWRHEGLRQ